MSELIFEMRSRNDADWLPAPSGSPSETLNAIPGEFLRKTAAALPCVS